MRNYLLNGAIVLTMAVAVAGCDSKNDETTNSSNLPLTNEDNERKVINLTLEENDLVKGSGDFAFELFRKVSSDKSEIVSPISVTYALGMLNNGATGETQEQINKVLGFGDKGADGINAFCKKMLTEAPVLDKLTKVSIANTIFLNNGYQLNANFVSTAKNYYNATPETRDFHDGKTMDVINKWASDNTNNMIEKVLDNKSFNPDAVSYLLNAIYFKGEWAEGYKFDKNETKDETFYSYNGNKTVAMMHQNKKRMYGETDDCKILSLTFGNEAYAIDFFLPNEGKTIQDVLSSLTYDKWQSYYDYDRQLVITKGLPSVMVNSKVDIKLPRLETSSSIELNDIMSALGMPNAFNQSKAEFPNFCTTPTFIGKMKQDAKIKLDETGAEAAAVTGTQMAYSGVEPAYENAVFHANRPFFYIIHETSTNAIFFIGQYTGE